MVKLNMFSIKLGILIFYFNSSTFKVLHIFPNFPSMTFLLPENVGTCNHALIVVPVKQLHYPIILIYIKRGGTLASFYIGISWKVLWIFWPHSVSIFQRQNTEHMAERYDPHISYDKYSIKYWFVCKTIFWIYLQQPRLR